MAVDSMYGRDFDAICANCGKRWGSHFPHATPRNACPEHAFTVVASKTSVWKDQADLTIQYKGQTWNIEHTTGQKPRFKSYCDKCQFLGYMNAVGMEDWDLYFCEPHNAICAIGERSGFRDCRIDRIETASLVLKEAYERFSKATKAQSVTRSADQPDFTGDLQSAGRADTQGRLEMTSATRNWLDYTDGLLCKQDDTAKEITTVMGIVRGPDYVRLRGGEISPREEDRVAVKKVTTAVLRARFFPKTAASLSKPTSVSVPNPLILQFQNLYGVSKARAEAMVQAAGFPLVSVQSAPSAPAGSWMVAPNGVVDLKLLDEQLGSKSHFTIKVKKALVLLGLLRG